MLKKQKYVTAVFCLFLSFFFAAMGILQYQMIRGKKPVSTDAGIEAMNNDTVLVGGMPIGIYMETDGVTYKRYKVSVERLADVKRRKCRAYH